MALFADTAQPLPDGARDSEPELKDGHALVLKALDSGGAVMVKENFFRTAYSFSGGSAATFALFSLADGRLQSAGNAYAYDGFIREMHLGDPMNVNRPVVGPPGPPPPAPR